MKKKILLYYYYEEITTDSSTSVTRLAASLLEGLQDDFDCFVLSYEDKGGRYPRGAKRIAVSIPVLKRLQRKVNNSLGLSRLHWVRLKRGAAKQKLKANGEQFDAVIVPGLDDMQDARTLFPGAKLLYWIHNISAICKPRYLSLIRYADYFVTPSRSAYHLLLQKMQPAPLLASYYFLPNWCEAAFYLDRKEEVALLRALYGIGDDAFVLIFSGGDHPVKGKRMLEQILPQLRSPEGKELVLIFAGGRQAVAKSRTGNVWVLHVGQLSQAALSAHYQLADAGLFPSQGYDHTPLTLLEMSISGVLPLASDIGGVKEMLGNDYPFLVHEPHSPENWIRLLEQLTAMPAAERKAAAAALRSAIELVYNRDHSLAIMKNILQQPR
ncbi:MAG TPA: glycosyltransferase family 4 protein [Panacibacter sp.]|nr:glycosyltransferase family 4 protein [Panacibacter sp.]HNP46554.1 glycosyltransferase family 4 protein [Panacibacter sp.]